MKLFLGMIAVFFAGSGEARAQEYSGWWDTTMMTYDGREVLTLGDSYSGAYTDFVGTTRPCGSSGDSYAWMRQVVSAADEEVTWWVEYDCGPVVQICVVNAYDDIGCSGYLWDGRWYGMDGMGD